MQPEYTDWMSTYTGKKFYPHLPGESFSQIDIRDIAHALSMSCRYGGHCRRFYSVAEHSVHLARFLLKDANANWKDRTQPRYLILEWALWALLHDASEAYVADIVRPAKVGLPEYKKMEQRIMMAVALHFNLMDVQPPYVTEIDNRILIDERQQNMLDQTTAWKHTEGLEPLGVTLQFWSPMEAEMHFLAAYYDIIEELHR
jgi:hypothetical protein